MSICEVTALHLAGDYGNENQPGAGLTVFPRPGAWWRRRWEVASRLWFSVGESILTVTPQAPEINPPPPPESE